MTYRTPESRRGPVEGVLKTLTAAHCVLLTTHINADGDGAGSEVALAGWLRAQGKEAWIINPTPYPESLSFLLPEKGWTLDSGSSDARDI
ncbi:MAG: hypothetical protein MUO50_05220, partial [Longimicrobiales bacterium]|nr:hypothetical protein [Longimicrobiales bacterium]